MKNIICKFLLVFAFCMNTQAQEKRTWGEWTTWGQQIDSTYCNPIIPADYSDIDCIRVGDTYYAISSTFQFSPGVTLLQSTDLVNWEICTNIISDITQIGDALNWDRMDRYGRGVWAGTLRHHNNRFYLFFGTPDEGYFMTSSPTPKGPWDDLMPLMKEPGWDDCTVMWDEDGSACFVGTHFADGYKTYMFNMSSDGKTIDRHSAMLINEGSGREANKLIRVGEWYYLIFSEHKWDKGRYVMAKRSKKMRGPYWEERQLALPSREAMEPNQGGIVEGCDGKWYFLTHHGTGDWSGRIVSLLPVTWSDGWPIIGTMLPDGIGTMAWSGRIPCIKDRKVTLLRSDDFNICTLGPQWQWNYQPRSEMFSLTERPGWLRMKAYKPLKPNQLLMAGNTLTQRTYRIPTNDVVVKMDLSKMSNGQHSGLCHFSSSHAALGVVMKDGKRYIEYRHNDQIKILQQIKAKALWLKSTWGLNGLATFSYSVDGKTFVDSRETYQMMWGNYRGDRVGIYNFNDVSEQGSVDVDYFYYR